MQAYAEGFELMHHSEFELDPSEIAGSGATGRSSARGCSSSCTRRSSSTATGSTSPPMSRTRARVAGRSTRRSTRACRCRRSARRSSRASPPGARSTSPPRCRRRCGTSSVGTPSGGQGGEKAPDPGERRRRQPLLEGLRLRRNGGPCALVVFGASGDLTQAEDLPGALLARASAGCCPSGSGRRRRAHGADDEAVGRAMKKAVREFGRDDFDLQVWRPGRRDALRRDRLRRGRRDRVVDALQDLDEQRGCSATASTSPCRRPPSRRSSTGSASGGAPRAGSG